jgi:hypothetical protein
MLIWTWLSQPNVSKSSEGFEQQEGSDRAAGADDTASEVQLAALKVTTTESEALRSRLDLPVDVISFNEMQLLESSCSVDETELEEIRAGYERDPYFKEAYTILKDKQTPPQHIHAWIKHYECLSSIILVVRRRSFGNPCIQEVPWLGDLQVAEMHGHGM